MQYLYSNVQQHFSKEKTKLFYTTMHCWIWLSNEAIGGMNDSSFPPEVNPKIQIL
jgi:hypothetical protein